jgi:hypothetical protein
MSQKELNMTQHQIIVKLAKKRWISPIDALNAGGGMKLSTRVGELRRAGYTILDKWHPSKSFKLYKCVGEPK